MRRILPNCSEARASPSEGLRLGARGHARQFLLLRYEDLLENTEEELSKMAEFVGQKASLHEIRRAIAWSSADRMKELEQQQSDQWSTTKEGRKDIKFVREARQGQWKASLSPAAVAEIEFTWGHLMQVLGYERVGTERNLKVSRPRQLSYPRTKSKSLPDRSDPIVSRPSRSFVHEPSRFHSSFQTSFAGHQNSRCPARKDLEGLYGQTDAPPTKIFVRLCEVGGSFVEFLTN